MTIKPFIIEDITHSLKITMPIFKYTDIKNDNNEIVEVSIKKKYLDISVKDKPVFDLDYDFKSVYVYDITKIDFKILSYIMSLLIWDLKKTDIKQIKLTNLFLSCEKSYFMIPMFKFNLISKKIIKDFYERTIDCKYKNTAIALINSLYLNPSEKYGPGLFKHLAKQVNISLPDIIYTNDGKYVLIENFKTETNSESVNKNDILFSDVRNGYINFVEDNYIGIDKKGNRIYLIDINHFKHPEIYGRYIVRFDSKSKNIHPHFAYYCGVPLYKQTLNIINNMNFSNKEIATYIANNYCFLKNYDIGKNIKIKRQNSKTYGSCGKDQYLIYIKPTPRS